jgi:peptide/nickel transport system substrate-binding protein
MFRKLAIFAIVAAFAAAPLPSLAQGKKDSVVMGMTLEPPGLDPTNAAAAAIAEVTLYNIYETLTKINEDGSVSPLLAESWQASADLKTYTFKLRKGVKFHNGEPFDSAAVKFSYDRNAVPTSTNKDKSLYQAFEQVTAPDAETIVIVLKYSEPNLPFLLGQAAADRRAEERADQCDAPVGTDPNAGAWAGIVDHLNKWPDYRNAAAIKLSR